MFNFKEFENLLKSTLLKAGFKPPIIRRERVMEERAEMYDDGEPILDKNGKPKTESTFKMLIEDPV
jgi:hypothetical protein